ncbi:MAG TPA: proteasome assembly chaperone family protein [Methanoregulaceae archaeon]|nr:proteasome assembly chaperone family protein [Methanoregulaceae archaeon]
MEDISVRYFDNFSRDELKTPVLLEGLPGIGHVGKLVAEHLIHELGARKIADIHSIYLPPQVIIDENNVIRLANNEIYLYDGPPCQLLFLVGDFQSSSNEGHYLLADCYLNIAEELGVRRIYTLGGFGVGHLVDEPRVLGAVNRDDLRAEAEGAGAVFDSGEPGGGIIGAAGLLLGLSAQRGIEGICLMGETSGYLVDPKSAASLLSVLSVLVGIRTDTTMLEERGAEMERMVQKMIEGEKGIQEDELRYIG